MSLKEEIHNILKDLSELLIDVNDRIWDFAETRFEEFKSAQLLKDILSQEGFSITEQICNMETAFIASYGTEKPIIGFLAEYDGLSGLSQEAGVYKKSPLEENGNGHGCGHHTLGAGSLAAALAVKTYLAEKGIPGTVRVYGCPGEEGGSGKTFMVREGVFDDLDIALTWHPFSATFQFPAATLANLQAYFRFYGTSSHAAASPHLGRSALDAVELMNVGVNYLREHVIPEASFHYAVTNTGGTAPNVVQAEAEVLYLIRAPKSQQVLEIYERICDVAKGAALMTGTKSEVVFYKACSDLVLNRTLDNLVHEKLEEAGPVPFDESDIQEAEEIRETLTENEKNSLVDMLGPAIRDQRKEFVERLTGKAIFDFVPPYLTSPTSFPGSTDVADVSWNVPTAQFFYTCYAMGTPAHSWQLVSQGKNRLTHNGMMQAAKVLALTALELFQQPSLIEKARAELVELLDGKAYECPIPKDVYPSAMK